MSTAIVTSLAVKRAGSVEAPDRVTRQNFKPKAVGWFTHDAEGNFCGEDTSQLKFLHLPSNLRNVNFDLNKSHVDDKFRFPITISENIDPILHWIKENKEKG